MPFAKMDAEPGSEPEKGLLKRHLKHRSLGAVGLGRVVHRCRHGSGKRRNAAWHRARATIDRLDMAKSP